MPDVVSVAQVWHGSYFKIRRKMVVKPLIRADVERAKVERAKGIEPS